MAVTDGRILPLARIQLFANGQGDPVVTRHQFGWYDLLSESYQLGQFSLDSAGIPQLEFLKEIGLCCRPQLVQQDSRLADFTLSGTGSWDERQPYVGSPRVYRIAQLDTTPGVEFFAIWNYSLPANPQVAFSLIFVDTPNDWDSDLFPPYVQIEFGKVGVAGSGDSDLQAQWALRFEKSASNGKLLRWLDLPDVGYTGWVEVMDLPSPPSEAASANAEVFITLRCLRGKIGVSLDGGFEYAWFGFATQQVESGSPLPASGAASQASIPIWVEGSSFTVRGQGGVLVFGVHQIAAAAGQFASVPRNTFTTYPFGIGTPTPVLTPRGYTPTPDGAAATRIDLTDASDGANASAAYLATLTPSEIVTDAPWSFYATPELYAVTFLYLPATAGGSGAYSEPWTWIPAFGLAPTSGAGIVEVDIDKPYEIDCSSARVRIRLNPRQQVNWNSGKWPKVRILLGHALQGGFPEMVTAFTGYVRRISTSAPGPYAEAWLDLEVENPIHFFLKRARWTEFDSIPLGGQTVNDAADMVLASEGLTPAYRLWHNLGDLVVLPAGMPEDPFEWPKPDETKYDTLRRIFGYAGIELSCLDDGRFLSLPKYWINSAGVQHYLEARPALALQQLVQSISFSLDSAESVSMILVKGTDWATGLPVWAYAVDAEAEGNPSSPRWDPRREVYREELEGTCTPEFLALRTQALALEMFAPKYECDVSFPVDLTWSRRDTAMVQGTLVGVNDYDRFVALTLQHRYRADPSFATLESTAGLRRLN